MSDGDEDNIKEHPPVSAWSSPLFRLIAVGLLLAALIAGGHLRVSIGAVDVSTTDSFDKGGSIPFRAQLPPGLSFWSSWSGSDGNRGTLVMGPISAPPRLGFYAAGYPRKGGNRFYLENVATGETFDPGWENFAETWTKSMITLPPSWIGQPIFVHAVDDTAEWGGWLALSAPFRVTWFASWWNGPPSRVCAFLLVGIHLGILLLGAAALARRLVGSDDKLVPLVAVGLMAAAGYLIFWLTFLHHVLGAFTAWALLASVIAFELWSRIMLNRPTRPARGEWMIPFWLTVGAGVFYVATLHEFSVQSPMSYVAQHRFASGLPVDNAISQIFAERLGAGLSPRGLIGDWLSSDRPPLQAGWVLMLRPVARLAGVGFDTLAQCAGIWFQLSWLPSLWLLLRSLGIRSKTVAVMIVALIPSGFLVFHSVYVWPKLGGAAFTVGAYAFWFLVSDFQLERRLRFGIGGAFAALAWLSHGGVAFSFVALVPLALWRWRSAGWRAWRQAAIFFFVGAIPWTAYQKLYEPPANRLLKWHIAGVIPIDDRSFPEALVDSYQEMTWNDWLQGRKANLRMIFSGPWSYVWSFNYSSPQMWRDSHAFAFFCFGWWNLGFGALPWVCIRARRNPPEVSGVIGTMGWALLTFALWVVLMLFSQSVFVHQGSYAPMIALFALLALVLWRLQPVVFFGVALFQVITFIGVWASHPEHWANVGWNLDAVILMGLSFVFLVVVAVRAHGRDVEAP